MIDAHAHLHHRQIKDKLEDIIANFKKAGGKYIVNSAIDLESACIVLDQTRQFSEIIPTVGIHPEVFIPGADIYLSNANSKWIKNNLDELELLLEKYGDIKAVGECGLDYYWVKKQKIAEKQTIFDLQKEMLTGQIKLAKKHSLPLVIHCRDMRDDKQCEAELLELIVKEANSCISGVFHSYTGSLSYLDDILALGFYISFNGIVTYKSAENVRDILQKVPLDRILIESDSPFLAPQKKRSAGIKVGEPAFVDEVAEFAADLKGISKRQLWKAVEENFNELFL
jgi:TatD DNase family protein